MTVQLDEDRADEVHGHWRFDVYRGDVRTDGDGVVYDLDGELAELAETFEADNLIVTTGKGLMLDRLFGLGTAAAVSAVGVGSGSVAADVANTSLSGASVLVITADTGTARAGQTVTIRATFGAGVANFTWAEAGLFNGVTNGTSTMFNRLAPIGPFTKSTAVSIVVTITITQS